MSLNGMKSPYQKQCLIDQLHTFNDTPNCKGAAKRISKEQRSSSRTLASIHKETKQLMKARKRLSSI